MKRTLSGELPSDPSHLNPPHEVALPQEQQPPAQQAAGVNTGAPAMQVPAANDPVTHPPASPFDADAPLPDWEEFAQMLPHTPPVETLHQAPEEEAAAAGEDEPSVEESSFEESSASSYDETLARRIESELVPSHDSITIQGSSVRELNEMLHIVTRHPQLTVLHIAPSHFSQGVTWLMQEQLAEFLNGEHTIETLLIQNPSPLGESRLEAPLLISMLQSHRLKHIRLSGFRFLALSDADRMSLIKACQTNSSLQSLHLKNCWSDERLAELLDIVAAMTTLEHLDLSGISITSIAKPLVKLIKSNPQLKTLTMSPSTPDAIQDITPLLETIRENNALEVLGFTYPLAGLPPDLAFLKRLAGLRSLKVLRLPNMYDMTTDAVNNLGELVKTLPALTSVHLGCIPIDQKNRLLLAQALQSIPRLTYLDANLNSFYYDTISGVDREVHFLEFLRALGKCPNLTSLSLSVLPSLDVLIQFLETHPRITELHLDVVELNDPQGETKLMNLVKKSSSITRIGFRNEALLNEQQMQFVGELRAALAINQQIQLNIGAASRAMHGLLLDRHLKDAREPFVPSDVTNELASAIARYALPEKAKAIFDELIIHDPSYRLQ